MNLQGRELKEGLKGDDVKLLQTELLKLGYTIPAGEIDQSLFGEETRRRVLDFQKAHGLGTTGVVDEVTARLINEEVEALQPFIVRGTVRQADGKPLPGGTVKAFDKDMRSEQELGKAETDTAGHYEITYRTNQFRRVEKGNADLLVRVYDQQNKELVSTPKPIFNALRVITVDLMVGGGKYTGPSEYERHREHLTPVLENVPLEELNDEDIEFLTHETGIEKEHITFLAEAERFFKEKKVPPEIFYGLFRQQIPADLKRLLSHKQSSLKRALKRSIQQNIIPLSFKEKIDAYIYQLQDIAVEDSFAEPEEGETPALGNIIKTTHIPDALQKKFVSLYLKHEDSDTTFWKKIEEDPDFQVNGALEELTFTFQIDTFTGRHLPLINELQRRKREGALNSARDLAKYSKGDWLNMINSQTEGGSIGVPPDVPGENEDEKKNNYAQRLVDSVEVAFPTAMLTHKIASDVEFPTMHGNRNDMLQFFRNNNPHFEFGTTYIDEFIEKNESTVLAGVDDREGLMRQLKSMQRVFKFAPRTGRYEVMRLLMTDGLDSAQAIKRMRKGAFIRKYSNVVGGDARAQEIYARASHISATALLLLGKYGSAFHSLPVIGEWAKTVDGIPNWKTLFGQPVLCECEHCRSVYSPAAYLVDLLQFLKGMQAVEPYKTALDVLSERRPDIGEIELSCENSNTLVPYVDLLNEVLEHAVAPFTSFNIDTTDTTLETDLDNRKLSEVLKNAFAGNGITLPDSAAISDIPSDSVWLITTTMWAYKITKESGQLHVSLKVPQTRGAADVLRAHPEYLYEPAYNKLANEAVYPWDLPFSLWDEEGRVYLEHLGVHRYQLMEAFHRVALPDYLTDIDIASEYLRLTPFERQICTDGLKVKAATIDRIALSGLQTIDDVPLSSDNLVLVRVQADDNENGIYIVKEGLWVRSEGRLMRVEQGTAKGGTYWLLTTSADGSTVIQSIWPEEFWGYKNRDVGTISWSEDVSRVSIFLEKSGLSYRELLELLDTKFINHDIRLGIEPTPTATGDDLEICDTSKLHIRNVSESDLNKIHRFVRLQRRLGWTMRELDRALTALNTADIDDSFIVKLSHIERLRKELKVPLVSMLSWWGNLDTATYKIEKKENVKSFYEQLFLNKAVLNPEDEVFLLNDARDELGNPFDPADPDPNTIRRYGPAILAALQISDSELALLIDNYGVQDKLNLDNLSRLYRLVSFSRALKLSISEFLSVKTLTGKNPFAAANTEYTLDFVEKVRKIRASGFSISELDYLLRHDFVQSSGVAPTEESIALVLGEIRDGLQKIAGETAVLPDPKGDVTREKLALLEWDETLIARALSTLNGSTAYTVTLTSLPSEVHDFLNDPLPSLLSVEEREFRLELRRRVSYDDSTDILSFIGPMTEREKTALFTADTADNPGYRNAVEQLFDAPRIFVEKKMKMFELPTFSAPLEQLPVEIDAHFPPDSLKDRIYFDVDTKQLRFKGIMTETEKTSLLDLLVPLDPATPYYSAINDLFNAPATYVTEPENYFMDPTDASNLFDSPKTAEQRFNLVLEKLMPYLRARESENLVKQKLANALKLDMQTTEQLLTRRINSTADSSRSSIIEFLDPVFAESNPAVHLTATAFAVQFNTFKKLHKVATVISKYKITANELPFLFDPGPGLGWLNMDNLPFASGPSSSTLFSAWERLTDLFSLLNKQPLLRGKLSSDEWQTLAGAPFGLRERIPPDEPALFNIFRFAARLERDLPTMSEEEILSAEEILRITLSNCTGWNLDDIVSLVGREGFNFTFSRDYRDERAFILLKGCIDLLKRLSMSAAQAYPLTDAGLSSVESRSIVKAVKARYDEERWPAVSGAIRDALREKQRSALVAYLVAGHGLRGSNTLYEFLLIDPEMSPCMMTSRIKQAISSVQLFVQRCLMGLERNVKPTPEDAREWKWMKNYRVWEANRKVFLYPENWIEPELRDNKSPFFKDLENDLLQNEITADTAETAYLHYLEKLHDVANLEIAGLFHQGDEEVHYRVKRSPYRGEVRDRHEESSDNKVDILHVFGRTRNTPHIYYYRQRIDSNYWTPWERVDLDIQSNHLLPVVWNRRLYLFWPIFNEKTMDEDIPGDGEGTKPIKYWEIKLAWSEYKSGKWSAKKVADEAIELKDVFLEPEETVEEELATLAEDIFEDNIIVEVRGGVEQYPYTLRWRDDASTINFYISRRRDETPKVVFIGRLTSSKRDLLLKKYDSDRILNLNISKTTYENTIKKLYEKSNEKKLIHEKQFFFRSWPSRNGRLNIDCYFTRMNQNPLCTARIYFNGCADGGKVVYINESRYCLIPPDSLIEYMEFVEIENREEDFISLYLTELRPFLTLRKTPGIFRINYSHQHYWFYSQSPFFYQDDIKTFFVTCNTTNMPSPADIYYGSTESFLFETFYHPYVCEFIKQLNRYGIEGLLDPRPDDPEGNELRRQLIQQPDTELFERAENYDPTDRVEKPYPREDVDFTTGGAYSLYNWELFFHAPLLIADRLSKNQRFEEAQKWFHYIFDPTDLSIHGLRATYFRNQDLTDPAVTRIDDKIDFDWGRASPIDGIIDPDSFSVRWTGKVLPKHSGTYTFYTETDDGVRLWVDNIKLINEWYPQRATEHPGTRTINPTKTITLKAGKLYDIRMEYYERGGNAVAKLRWEGPSTPKEIIPQSKLYAGMPYWKVRPFFEETQVQSILEIMRLINDGDPEMTARVEQWRNNPFNPHLIAFYRKIAYQKTVVMKYIDNLITWGDQLFRRDTIESINEATQLYILAAKILGPHPEIIPPLVTPQIKTYNELDAIGIDAFSNVEIESLVWELSDGFSEGDGDDSFTMPPILYFNIPKNDKLLGYWDTVEDRLFKIRHCMNIEGVVRELPLFQPPIEPGLLVRAAAAGVDISSALNDINVALPHYRFQFMLQKALELCADVKALGAALLSTLEKRDAEKLALLRSGHEIRVLDAVRQIKEQQIDEAEETHEGLLRAQEATKIKHDYYKNIKFMNSNEKAHLNLLIAATLVQTVGQFMEIAAGSAHVYPDKYAGGAGSMGSPLGFAQIGGGSKTASALQAFGRAMNIYASFLNMGATQSSIMGNYQRRADDWRLQEDMSAKELEQIEKQIVAAEIRQAIAEQDLNNHDKQIENAKEVDAYMREKFTNQELYDWMVSQTSTIYFQSYQMAYDLAKRAQKALQHELGTYDTTFIRFGYWDSLKKGLMAGEKLHYDLKRMEMSYLEQNKREYEITKHISLAMLDPVALVMLKETSECFVSLPEVIFDLDYPGHYMRRIKSVSLTVPCVTGPYTSVNCTLTLLTNSVRYKNLPTGNEGNYKRDENGEDARFKDNIGSIQSIATSSAKNDSGVFELNFRDERYLPFEGAGVISTWSLELSGKWEKKTGELVDLKQFDFDTISDVIFHINYTARDGGETLKDAAVSSLEATIKSIELGEGRTGLFRIFSLRHEFPNNFHDLLSRKTTTLQMEKHHFPYMLHGKSLSLTEVKVFLKPKDGLTIDTENLSLNIKNVDAGSWTTIHGNLQEAIFSIPGDPIGDWPINATNAIALKKEVIEDIFILLKYTIAP
ncbi:MAG: neuraminidase-like domain-containing protein [Candidatus Scalindua sp.]|nr:neuraminidase-like domain-containing protein [Candidatus Scalindua sp.]